MLRLSEQMKIVELMYRHAPDTQFAWPTCHFVPILVERT